MMENPMAAQAHYSEHMRQAAWINDNDWQFEKPAQRHPVRATVAKVLLALANAMTPPTQRDAHAA
jgi:hypothetical protein